MRVRSVKDMFVAFIPDSRGAVAAEYALIIALITIVMVAGITAFGGAMANLFASFTPLVPAA
jgi:Flp pilus assembly pilin Flp